MGFSLATVILVWIIGFGALSWFLRERVSSFFLKSRLPALANYFIILTPLVLLEEFLTCETPFFVCIQTTLPAFWLFFLILYFVQKRLRLNYLHAALLFGLMGWFNEFILVGRIFQYDLFITILFTILVIPVYSVLAILPCHYLGKPLE